MKRDYLEIIKEVLEYCSNVPKRSTWISQKCRLASQLLSKILDVCVDYKLLEVLTLKNGARFLKTKKGALYIQRFNELTSMIGVKEKIKEAI